MNNIFTTFRRLRRKFKSKLPYVRRRQFRKAEEKYAQIIKDCSWGFVPANQAKIREIKPFDADISGEVCFFVTFSPENIIKPHVLHHIDRLSNNGIKVVLVVNSKIESDKFIFDKNFVASLSGLFVRDNIGFDFAAWAHLYSLCKNREHITRMYWINDSIVGPLDDNAFSKLIERVRWSKHSLLGLTENIHPLRHVQSYFLVFNQEALKSDEVHKMLMSTLCFSTKELVIDSYEVNLTKSFENIGLTVGTLFPTHAKYIEDSNDTYFRWQELINSGFPYIKTSVIKEKTGNTMINRLVPINWLKCKL